jgi:hypothetical protein
VKGAACKRKGTRAELEAGRILAGMGYDVTKAGGSLGAFDLVCVPRAGSGHMLSLLVQVKCNRWPSGKALQVYFAAAKERIATCVVWRRDDGGPGRKPRWRERDLGEWYCSERDIVDKHGHGTGDVMGADVDLDHVVRLELSERQRELVRCLGTARHLDNVDDDGNLKPTYRGYGKLTPLERDIVGVAGEYAVHQHLGIPYRTAFLPGGDGGRTDVAGHDIQIKTVVKPVREAYLIFDHTMRDFRADDAVLVCLDWPALEWADVAGWVTRTRFEQESQPHDFGHGPRLVMTAGQLRGVG